MPTASLVLRGRAVLLLGLVVPPAGAAAQTAPIAVTTDSVAYCDSLARRVSLAPTTVDVTRLAHEGAALCGHGHVRGGIRQLRRALLLAGGERPPAP